MIFPMELRCRVTFYDVEQRLRRSIEVQADSLVDAAEIVLRRLMERFLLPSDFAPTVDVEVISSVHHTLKLSEVENRLRGVVEQQDRAA